MCFRPRSLVVLWSFVDRSGFCGGWLLRGMLFLIAVRRVFFAECFCGFFSEAFHRDPLLFPLV